KTKLKGTPLLLIRTQDERERLITEKVAIILTSEENKLTPPSDGNLEVFVKSSLQSEMLAQLQNQGCCLWEKASASPSPKDCDLYYVESLSYIISPSTIKAGSKLKHLSQVPCRLKTPEKCLPRTVEDTRFNPMGKQNEIMTGFSQDSLSQQTNEEESLFSECGRSDNQENINTTALAKKSATALVEKSSQFVPRFIDDWSDMLNNSSMSDIKIRVQGGEEIYVHELVLFVRCPNILLDVKQANDTMKYIIWDKISFNCAFAFLDFIYCGSTCKINDLKYCADEIIFLSMKYCVEDLCFYLKCIMNEDNYFGIAKRQNGNDTSSDINSKVVKQYNSDFNEATIGNFHLASACKTNIERSIDPVYNVRKEKEKLIESNCESSDKAIFVGSSKKNDSLHESCLSPDPFVDSCDNEIINTSSTRKNSFPNTQQNMDNLLEALNMDEDEKFHPIEMKGRSKIDSKLSGTCGFVRESSEVEIVEDEKYDIYNASTIKKRKQSDYCDSLDVKQICTNHRNSVRKSLLSSFSGEGENFLSVEKIEVKISHSPKICKNNSLNSVESVGKDSVNGSNGGSTKEISSKKVLKEVENTDGSSPMNDVVTIECSPSISSEKLSDAVDKVDTSTDLLGDFCADYEYQNYYANYSPCSEEIPFQPKYGAEKSVENPVMGKQQLFKTEETSKSPFSSPLSVKSLSRADSSFSHRTRHSRKKLALTRTRSNSDISLNYNAFSPSPISVKCLSQSSIHLKSSHDTNTDKNKVLSVSDVESDDLKIGISLEINVPSPATPSTHVQRTPNRSLNSVKRLLEDSFTAEHERNLLARKLDSESWPCSTPNSTQSKKKVFSKHLQSIKDGDNCVTPMADYSGMDTPMLKKELQKYGLKPLKRKRAKQILRHIYNELHPLVPVHSKDGRSHPVSSPAGSEMPFSCTEKRAKKMSIPKKSKKNNKMDKDDAATVSSSEEAEISSENEVSFPSTQESSSSSQCQFEVLEDPAEDYALTQIDVSQLPGVVLNYIRKTPEFHQQVLLYEPIWLEQLQEGLKALSYKFKLTQLMEYLDEKCITFRTIHGSKTKQKQKKKKSK
ncbi:Structure-specific endonuclease subunit SLX4, partial [Gryllus bimaculatus]